jgi:FADH2 O2-dependent halogenase
MPVLSPDVLILGSGFGGSLLALILARAGKSVVMVDRSRHPRFAIGESSTPLADRTLAQMADRYQLPELRPLCHWGSWKREYPDLLCGKKRGFTYFDQTSADDVSIENFDERRLLVSASINDEYSDTHWLRSDIDQFIFRLANTAGVVTFQNCIYQLEADGDAWILKVSSSDEPALSNASMCVETLESFGAYLVKAPFVVDATGSSKGILSTLGIADQTASLKTHSRSLFAHFEAATACEQLLKDSQINLAAFPYHCDDAAVHQVCPDGWMWQLRYDDDTLSAGFMIDERPSAQRERPPFSTPQEEWDWRIQRAPFLARQFRNARIVRPDSGLQQTSRIQRLTSQAAGSNWAAITNTAGFIDPLHSTGIAHTLFSVSRLAEILLMSGNAAERDRCLRMYSESLIEEIRCVDELVEGCYEAIPSFRLWCFWGMLYFAAATSMEQSLDGASGGTSFLRANDPDFRSMLKEARDRLAVARHAAPADRKNAEQMFESWLCSAVAPWNQVGLFDPTCNGLYSKTAAPARS